MTNLQATIDALGVIKAEIATLEVREKALKAALSELSPGAYEGEAYRLTISDGVRESHDKVLKAKIAELVEEHLSRQYVTAHTVETPVRTHRVVARTGQSLAA